MERHRRVLDGVTGAFIFFYSFKRALCFRRFREGVNYEKKTFFLFGDSNEEKRRENN